MSDSSDASLLNIFRDEVDEYLTTLNTLLMDIETAETLDAAAVRELNRVAHSMKGASRAVGLKVIESIAHCMEEVFDAALKMILPLTPAVCDLLYDGLDLIQAVVTGESIDQDTLNLVLSQLQQVIDAAVPGVPDVPIETPALHIAAEPALPLYTQNDGSAQGGIRDTLELGKRDTSTVPVRPNEESIRVAVSKLDRMMGETSELLVARMQADERLHEIQVLRGVHGKWRREWQGIRAAYIRLARRLQNDEHTDDDMLAIFKFLEVNQRYLLEANKQLTQLVQALGQDNLRFTTLTDQLQDDVSGMRMVAFESLHSGLLRVIRDLARDTDKQVLLDVEGMGVEVDKTVLDALKDPIIHLLRNAVDHGIEPPAEREARGKPPIGQVMLSVEQRGNEIIVRISDDGWGIDVLAVRDKAVGLGLISAQEADLLPEEEIRSLIFHPGMTTAAQVTHISGRGIGLDVVRDRIESLRGRVSIQSEPGTGTTIILNVPVSLTRIRCVVLELGDESYAVPSAVITRMMTVSREAIFTAENRDMIVLDDRPVPLVSMADVLGVVTEGNGDSLNVVVLQAADRTVAFEVDSLHSERELVLKPLGPEIARARYVSGAALLGTGAVIIVLDANDLIRSATGRNLPPRRLPVLNTAAADVTPQRYRVLVVDDSITTRTLEKNILETAGFDVTVAIDGEEAWQKITEDSFDVVISDVEMPRMNGLDLVRHIKGNTRTQHLPVILLTSLARPEHQAAGLKAGADAYLVKSQFDQGELLQMIWSVI